MTHLEMLLADLMQLDGILGLFSLFYLLVGAAAVFIFASKERGK